MRKTLDWLGEDQLDSLFEGSDYSCASSKLREIERMAQKAEEFCAENGANNARIEAKMEISGSSCDTLTKNRKKNKYSKMATRRRSMQCRKLWIGWRESNWQVRPPMR